MPSAFADDKKASFAHKAAYYLMFALARQHKERYILQDALSA